MNAAKRAGADFAVDIYPFYGSDVEATLRAGHDLRHGLIGPGVYASHGYERSHKKGVENTLKVLLEAKKYSNGVVTYHKRHFHKDKRSENCNSDDDHDQKWWQGY